MKTKKTSMLCATLAAAALSLAPASAVGDRSPAPLDVTPAETYGGCGIGGGYYGGGHYRGGSHYRSGYRGSSYRGGHSYRTSTRCRVIDRHYFHRGCYRYCRITYRHETVDCYGRVLRCWTSCKTVRC